MSEIRATTISDAAGTGPITLTKQSAAKAWINFNGQGTIATRDSANVASLTDLGTGYYAVNLTNSFNSADYSTTMGGNNFHTATFNSGAGVIHVFKYNSSHVAEDANYVYNTAHGDLA